MSLTPPTQLARNSAAEFDASFQIGGIAPQLRRMDRREDANFIDHVTHSVGNAIFALQFEAEKRNTLKSTPDLVRRAVDLLPKWMLNPDREWSSGNGGTGIRGCDFRCKSSTKVEIFITTEAGDLAYRVTERRRRACRERVDRFREANPGAVVNRSERQFRFPPSHFDKSNPAHGSYVTFTRKQIMDALASEGEPEQLELAL